MPTTDRYVVQFAYRNASGDWYASTAPDLDDQWFFVRDTAEDASDWTDDEIAPGPYFEDVESACKVLNQQCDVIARLLSENAELRKMANRMRDSRSRDAPWESMRPDART